MRKLKVIPPMQCDDGCGDCCGMVPVTETEFQRVARYVKEHGIVPVEHTGKDGTEEVGTCPVFLGGKCAVYKVRPLICQMFGHVEKLPCSRGYNVDIPQRDADRMLASNGEPTRLLHELIPGYAERAGKWASERNLRPNLKVW